MVLRFVSGLRRARPIRYRVPQGQRIYAIGDIHGCLAELEQLLELVEIDAARDHSEVKLVFLGDYIDRGPDSAGVIERLTSHRLVGHQFFLLGNHEEALLSVLDGDLEAMNGWLRFGGVQTLESYGLGRAEILKLGPELPRRMKEVIPPEHVTFLHGCIDCIQIGDYFFAHAGIRPGIPLSHQSPFDLRWIRNSFLDDDATDHGVVVVHGHTISDEVQIRPNRIGVDTGCYKTGRLTAAVLEGGAVRVLSNEH